MTESSDTHIEQQQLPFSTDAGAGERARIGLLVLESDQTMEWEFRQLTQLPGVSVYHTRLANDLQVTPESLAKMEHELPRAAQLLPRYLNFDAIGYGCTSGATVIGEARVAQIVGHHHPDVPVSNPLSAAKAALRALGVKRLALLTPYTPDVTRAMQASFQASGIAVTVIGSFNQQSDLVVGTIDSPSILEAAVAIGHSERCDGVFISCTSLRAAGIIEAAEARLGKPVTASNHALAWHLLRLSGVQDSVTGVGQLFDTALPAATK